jgi:hypothetical protein
MAAGAGEDPAVAAILVRELDEVRWFVRAVPGTDEKKRSSVLLVAQVVGQDGRDLEVGAGEDGAHIGNRGSV